MALASCATRSLTIQSNPTGAEVFLDQEYVGVTPLTLKFTYGGEREILLYPPERKTTDAKSYRPKRILYDTTRDAFDLPVIDLAADISGAEDRQKVDIELTESNLRQLYAIDPDAWHAAVRRRADTLRARAREFQLGALPTSQGRDPGPLDQLQGSEGRDPGPLDSQPATRRQPSESSPR